MLEHSDRVSRVRRRAISRWWVLYFGPSLGHPGGYDAAASRIATKKLVFASMISK